MRSCQEPGGNKFFKQPKKMTNFLSNKNIFHNENFFIKENSKKLYNMRYIKKGLQVKERNKKSLQRNEKHWKW